MRLVSSHTTKAVQGLLLALVLGASNLAAAQSIPTRPPATVPQKAFIIPDQGTILISGDKAQFHPGLMPMAHKGGKDICQTCSCCSLREATYDQFKTEFLANQESLPATETLTEIRGFWLDPNTQASYDSTSQGQCGLCKWNGTKKIHEIDVEGYLKDLGK